MVIKCKRVSVRAVALRRLPSALSNMMRHVAEWTLSEVGNCLLLMNYQCLEQISFRINHAN